MANQLTFGIGADVSPALQAMTAVEQRTVVLQQRIQSLQNVIGQTTSVQKLNQAMTLLGKTQSELSRVSAQAGNALSSRLTPGSNEASQSLLNLSRVAQDAPFGILGIANNINPLVESFGRLKASTGTTGGALKALGGALAGPGGIGLAIGVASSLLVVFRDKLFGSSKAAKQLKDDVEEFKKSLDSAKASSISTGLQLQQFVDIAKNGNLPLEQRNEALRKANDILGDYGKTLNLTNVATESATKLVQEYTKGLIAQSLATQYADRIAALLVKQATAQQDVTKAQIEYNKAQQALINRPALSLRDQELGRGQAFIIQRDNALKKLTESQDIYGQITKEVTDLTKQFNQQAIESTKLLGDIGKKPAKVKIEPYFDEIKGIDLALKEFEDLIRLRASAGYQNRLKIAMEAFITEPKPTYFQELQKKTVDKVTEGFLKLKGGKFTELMLPQIDEETEAFGKAFVKLIDDINGAIQNLQVEGLSRLGEAIGAAFSGGDIRGVFQGFIDTISGAITAIGKQMIALGIKAALLKKALSTLFANPIALVAAGVGLVAVGSAIRGALSKGIEAREKGGPVSGNTPYLVGERGPELFVPSVSGSIVPNNQLSAFNGRPAFAMAGGGGRSIVRGTDILLASARTQRSIARVNG